jgi:hypothetical protein
MRPVILFNFGYNRNGWITPIEDLKNDVQIVYLYYIDKSQQSVSYTEQKIIYWSDFNNSNHLLDTIQPDKIVFMSVDSGLGILLNYTARKRGIPTFILQHGVYSNYNDYRAREKRAKLLHKETMNTNDVPRMAGFSTGSFYKNSLHWWEYLFFLLLPIYSWLQKKKGLVFAAKWVQFSARKPTKYICYHPQNALIHVQTDKATDDKLLYIGNPEFDKFYNYKRQQNPVERYYLLIDQPLSDNRYGEHICTQAQMTEHYLRLNQFCMAQNAKLYVKLHPESYNSYWLPQHPNIKWISDHNNLPELVLSSEGCFGYFSTLLVPAIYFARVVLFKVSNNEMQDDTSRLKLCQLLDFFSYTIEQIDFSSIVKDHLDLFVRKYIYFDDGNSSDRLKRILIS